MFENPALNYKIILKTDTYIYLFYSDCVSYNSELSDTELYLVPTSSLQN